MTGLLTRNRNLARTGAGLTWIVVLAVAPSLYANHGELFVMTDDDSNFFPATAEVIAATPAVSTFGDDADTSLAQSFTVTSAFSLETIFLQYENDNGSPGDKTVTMSIFPVADVNANSHVEPPDPNDFLLSESVTFPFVGGTDTVAGIHLPSPLALAPGGYLLHFSGTTNPGWEWLRTVGGTGGSVYADGHAYENGTEKGSGDGARDFSLALTSVALDPPVEPIDAFSVQSGDLLAGTTWDNGLAPVGAPPNPNFIHNIVNGHALTADGSQAYTGAGLNITEGSLTYTGSAVQLPFVTVAAGTTVAETTTGEFFLGDVSAPELGKMELNGQLTITAEGGADAGLDMTMAGTGTATVNVESGGTLFLTDMSEFQGVLQFNGSGDEVLYEGPPGGAMTLELNSMGANRLAMGLADNGGSADVIFSQPGEIDHRSDLDRLMGPNAITANASIAVDLTKTFVGNERRMFSPDGWHGTGDITVNGTPTDPTGGDVTLNEFETGSTSPGGPGATHLATDSYAGTLTANAFLNVEVRHNVPAAEVIVNQNARLEFGHRDVESLFTTQAGEVTVNSGGRLEVGYEEDDSHVPYQLQLTTQRGMSGDLILNDSATTIIQISGSEATKFDTIAAEGTVTLNGTLEVLINPDVPSQTVICQDGACVYTPSDGDTFEIVSIVPETLSADYDASGTVGPEDYDIWKETFGDEFDVTADGNNDGVVGAADYTIWRDNLGAAGGVTGSIVGDFDSMVITDPQGVLAGFTVSKVVTPTSVTLMISAGTGGTAVPEPSSLLLASLAVSAFGLARQWQQRLPIT